MIPKLRECKNAQTFLNCLDVETHVSAKKQGSRFQLNPNQKLSVSIEALDWKNFAFIPCIRILLHRKCKNIPVVSIFELLSLGYYWLDFSLEFWIYNLIHVDANQI